MVKSLNSWTSWSAVTGALLLIGIISVVTGEPGRHKRDVSHISTPLYNLELWGKTVRHFVDEPNEALHAHVDHHLKLADHLSPTLSMDNSSFGCSQKVREIFGHSKGMLRKQRKTIIDASGKVPGGLYEGNLGWLGNYRQCVDTEGLHYCILSSKKNTIILKRGPINPYYGLCMPQECTSDHIHGLKDRIAGLDFHVPLRIHCYPRQSAREDTGFIVAMVFVLLLLALNICATLYDNYAMESCTSANQMYSTGEQFSGEEEREREVQLENNNNEMKSEEQSRGRRVLISFSLERNISRIMSIRQGPSEITCLHGLRVISMFWVILCHQFMFPLNTGTVENIWMFENVFLKRFSFQAVVNGYTSIDTFLLIGGLLATYTGLMYLNQTEGRLNWFLAIFQRYLRLTPSLSVMLIFTTYIFPYIGDGPIWFKAVDECAKCRTWWWTYLLFINNFVPFDMSGGCMTWLWYLAVDMQFFLLSIPIVMLLWRRPKIGVGVIVLLTLATVVVRGVIFALKDFEAARHINWMHGDVRRTLFTMNARPHGRAVCYLVGMLVGYYFHRQKNTKRPKINPIVVIVGWIAAFTVGLLVVYGLHSPFRAPRPEFGYLTKAENVTYGALYSLAWALAVSWVVFACHMGYGGPVNRLLSSKLWMPFSKLTFCAYLLHPAVIFLYLESTTQLLALTVINQSVVYCGLLMVSYGVAFIMSSLVEMPFFELRKLLLRRASRKGSESGRKSN